MTTTIEKRKFYNNKEVGTAGFGKTQFFQAVLAMANGEEVDDNTVDLVGRAAEYELEGIANRPTKSGSTGEKRDRLQSDYANELRAAILPFVDATPRTAKDLIAAATAKGIVGKSGKPYNVAWVATVLNAEPGITCVKQVVEVTNSKGLKQEKECNCYKR